VLHARMQKSIDQLVQFTHLFYPFFSVTSPMILDSRSPTESIGDRPILIISLQELQKLLPRQTGLRDDLDQQFTLDLGMLGYRHDAFVFDEDDVAFLLPDCPEANLPGALTISRHERRGSFDNYFDVFSSDSILELLRPDLKVPLNGFLHVGQGFIPGLALTGDGKFDTFH